MKAVEDLRQKAGSAANGVPSLITMYNAIITRIMILIAVLSLGSYLVPFENRVRYPEGHSQVNSENMISRNFDGMIAFHKKYLAIADKWEAVIKKASRNIL